MVSLYALLALNVVGGLLGVGRDYLESVCHTSTDETAMVVAPASEPSPSKPDTPPPKKATKKKGKRKKSKSQKEE